MFPITFEITSIWPYVTSVSFAAVGAAVGAGLFWVITKWFIKK
jgi:hypothetical protein